MLCFRYWVLRKVEYFGLPSAMFSVSGMKANLRVCPIIYLSLTFVVYNISPDRLCGLVVRVSGYRYRGLGFDSRRYQIF